MKKFIETFTKDLVGTTYKPEDFPPEYKFDEISHVLEVLEGRGYLARFRRQDGEYWIKIKETPPDFDYLAEKDAYYETLPEDEFLVIFEKDLVGTVYDPESFLPQDISFTVKVLEYGGYINRMKDGNKWVKTRDLPSDYDFTEEAGFFYTKDEKKERLSDDNDPDNLIV